MVLIDLLPSLALIGWCHGVGQLRKNEIHDIIGAPPSIKYVLPAHNWFKQKLDHFGSKITKTWKQRFQVRDEFYTAGGPVFLFIGGEGKTSAGSMLSGAWVDYAQEYNALIVQLEHRYYGKSQPTSDLSLENLKYLSSEQALADLAYFIEGLRLEPGTKVVVFGCSYSGNLAAWARLKYPHLVHAAIASSAPLLAKVDFSEYMEVVRDSLKACSDACVTAIKAAYSSVHLLLRHPLGWSAINQYFRLCDPIDTNNKNDVIMFLEALAANFKTAVQENNIFLDDFILKPSIDTLCNIMTNASLGPPIVRLAQVNYVSMIHQRKPTSCLNYKYASLTKQMKKTDWDSNKFGERQWMYQTCKEFGYFQTSSTKDSLFGSDFPLGFYTQLCSDIFGDEFNLDLLEQGVNRTNTIYKGLDINATRVAYVHGSIDPWHPLGVVKTRIPESPAIYITGTAHCADMFPPRSTDLPALKAARQQLSALIREWLTQA